MILIFNAFNILFNIEVKIADLEIMTKSEGRSLLNLFFIFGFNKLKKFVKNFDIFC